jgi:hypothetical protein
MDPAKGMGGNNMKTIFRSLMVLGLISVFLMGIAWAGGSETKKLTSNNHESGPRTVQIPKTRLLFILKRK